MDRGNILATVQAAPQVITITADAALIAALQDIRNTLGELLAETRETKSHIATMAPVMIAESEARAAWDRQQEAIALALQRNMAPGADPGANVDPGTTPAQTPQEGAENAATGASQQVDPATLDWFVGQDGSYYVRGTDGGPDRRATKREILAFTSPKETRQTSRKRR